MNQTNTTQNSESLNDQTTIPQILRFHWWIVICYLIADISMLLFPEDTPVFLAANIAAIILAFYWNFTFFLEIALYYKENGKWQILPTILMLVPYFIIIPLMIYMGDALGGFISGLPCYIAPFFLKIVEKESTQKSYRYFAIKSGCLWTIIPAIFFGLFLIFCLV